MTGFEECIWVAGTLLIYFLYAVPIPKKIMLFPLRCLLVRNLGIRTKIGHGNSDLLLSNKLPCQFPAYSENIKELLHCILN
jgi:hypothetical protein